MKVFYKKIKIHLFSFFAGAVNGLLGIGGGTVIMPTLYGYLDDERDAHNTVSFFVLPLSIVSASICRQSLDYKTMIPLCLGAVCGGFIGLKLSKKFSINFLRILFSSVIIYSGIRGLL